MPSNVSCRVRSLVQRVKKAATLKLMGGVHHW